MTAFTESVVEDATLEWFGELCYPPAQVAAQETAQETAQVAEQLFPPRKCLPPTGTKSGTKRNQVGTKLALCRHQVSRGRASVVCGSQDQPRTQAGHELRQPTALVDSQHPAQPGSRCSPRLSSRGWSQLAFTSGPARRDRFKTCRSPATGALSPVSASESPIWAENDRSCLEE